MWRRTCTRYLRWLTVLVPSIIGSVKDEVLKRVPGSTAEFVVYPATLDNYTTSESDGVVGMRKLIDAYVKKCSASLPLVIMGYSQGAQVSADALVGQQVAGFPANSSISQPLPASTLARIAAVTIMGDPSFVPNETFHVGNASMHGFFPRSDVSNFNIAGLASRTKSYCDFNDPYCAFGNFSTGLSVHLGYVKEYGSQAADFVVKQIKAYNGGNGTSTSSNGTSTSGTGSPSSTSSTPAAYTGAASTFAGFEMAGSVAAIAGLVALMM